MQVVELTENVSLTGYGDTIRWGLDNAIGEIMVIVEADHSFRAKDLGKMLEFLKDADMVIYHQDKDIARMFGHPRYVIKGGEIIVEEGDMRAAPIGQTLHVSPSYDPGIETDIAEWFEQFYSIRFRNYPVSQDYLHAASEIACSPRKS